MSQDPKMAMENKSLINKVARRMGIEASQAAKLMDAFAEVVTDRISNLDSIAIPGFGNFVAMKLPERIHTDPSTGRRMLLPPKIKVEFVASTKLRNQLGSV